MTDELRLVPVEMLMEELTRRDGGSYEYGQAWELLVELWRRLNIEPQVAIVERPVKMRLVCTVCGHELATTLLPAGNNSTVGTPLTHYCQQTKQLSTFVMEVSG